MYKDKIYKFSKSFFDSVQIIIIAIAAVVIIYIGLGAPTTVEGSSMIPSLESGNIVITEKLTGYFGRYNRGDIVAFKVSEDKNYVKRIIGIAGDKVKFSDGKIEINGVTLKENYLTLDNQKFSSGQIIKENEEIIVPSDKYLMLGDNRNNSIDSRIIGFVDQNKIIGKAWCVLWPVNETHFFEHINYPGL